MNKLILLLSLITITTFAQQTFIDTTAAGLETRKYVSTKSATDKAPLPVQLITVAPPSYSDVGVAYMRGCTDTVGASWVDTLSRKIVSTSANNLSTVSSYWWQASILSDDTIQVSSSSSFAFGTVLTITPELPVVTPRLLYSSYTNLYIRKASGVTGTPKYFITYQGN